ncbi:MAG: phosphatase PAP2 family protein, partial [Candidatus Thermoplasmatota archaeon]|nr:phosphatase PAP2 family protein [Candidatus Thermoplasmatota archaeon]
TPEIHNWFNRIDPFTNGMPSLHIGLPFAIWLSMHKWDEDGRWKKFRGFLISFILLTSIAIVYLGIHWFVDIIGGMVVGIMAVNLTSRTHKPIWKFADERLFTRRLARTLDNPKGALSYVRESLLSIFDPIREPGKKQTGAIIMGLLILTGSVLLWDVTHQRISVEEAESPTSASGSGDWLVWIEESERGVEITSINVSSGENRSIGGQGWIDSPMIVSSGGCFVLFDDFRADYFEHNVDSDPLNPVFRYESASQITDLAITTDSNGEKKLAVLLENELRIISTASNYSNPHIIEVNSSVVASSGPLVGISENSENGPYVNLTSIESNQTISISLDSSSSSRIEQSIVDSGVILDFQNSTVVELEMENNWLVATVDLGPFNRTILVDTLSINQTLISNPRWDSSSPTIGDGKVAFLQVTRDDLSLTGQNSVRNNDVYVHDLSSGETQQYTFDENIDQTQPQILYDKLAYIQVNEQGTKELQLYSLTDTIEPRNSILLQASILALIPLLFLWTLQSYGASQRVTQRA